MLQQGAVYIPGLFWNSPLVLLDFNSERNTWWGNALFYNLFVSLSIGYSSPVPKVFSLIVTMDGSSLGLDRSVLEGDFMEP